MYYNTEISIYKSYYYDNKSCHNSLHNSCTKVQDISIEYITFKHNTKQTYIVLEFMIVP